MRKIYVTRQFFEASGPQDNFFEKTKNPFLDMVLGSECTKFQVCIFFRCGQKTPYRQTYQQSHIFTSENRYILDRLLASSGF